MSSPKEDDARFKAYIQELATIEGPDAIHKMDDQLKFERPDLSSESPEFDAELKKQVMDRVDGIIRNQ